MNKQPLKFATLAALAVMAAPPASLHARPPLIGAPALGVGAMVAEYKTRGDIEGFVTSIKAAAADTSATAAGAKNAVKLVGLYKEVPAVLKAVSELKVDASPEAQKAFADALAAYRKSPYSLLLCLALAHLEIDREIQREKIYKEVTDAAKPIPDAIEAFANGFTNPLSGDHFVTAKVKLLPSSSLTSKGASPTEGYATEFAKALPTLTVAKANAGKVLPSGPDQQSVATAYATYGRGTPPDFAKADAAVKKLGANATKLDGDLKDLFGAYADHIPLRLVAIEALVADVHRNRSKFKGPALDYQEVERAVAGALGSVVAAWNVYNDGNGASATNTEAQRIGRQLPGYLVAIQGIELALTPLSHRENHRVELYYFRDLQRLLKALRPDADTLQPSSTPTADLAEMRDKILAGDYARDSELANLSDLQQKLIEQRARATALKEKAAEAKKAASAAEERARESERKLIRLETNQSRAKERRELAETALSEAKETATKHANDPALTPEQKADHARRDGRAVEIAERNLARAQEVERQAEEAVELEQQRNKTILEDKTKADTALTEAQAAVKANADAQAESEKAIRESAVKIASIRAESAQLVQQDNRVFAELRDNQPYMFARGNPNGETPLERVQFIGLKDKQRLILSGDRVDLVLVEDLISQFDRPAPQAKLILRVLEVGVIHDQDGIGARNYNRAFDEIRDILADVREKTTAVGTLLRDCINERVRLAEATAPSPIVAPTVSISPSDATLLRRFSIYEPDVLRSLGAPGIFSSEEEVAFAVRNIPDPSRTTTLGEALLVLMLTSHAEQRQIADDFRKRAQIYLSKFKPFPGQDTSRLNFAGSRRVMGIDEFGSTRFGLSPQQKELVAAIQRRTVECIVPEMREMGIRIDELQDFSKPGQFAKNPADQAELDGLHRSLKTRYGYLNDQFALNGAHLDRFFVGPRHENDAYFSFVSQFPVSEVNARIAAADKMLKDIIERIEDDVNRVIVDPAMAEIREKLRKGRLEVGLLTTTEVLSTNRFPARVDAGASAQVAVGSQYDVLSAAQQLASLAAASNGATALNFLRQLKSDANEPSREIYGIGTGGLFNVTPYFDPSGQSLRFTFDYFTANRVREPNGTTNPQLPRIERHSINTEVELSSFELRYISEFTSNSKLGTARHQWGGIPILNDIPVLKELPIIGWFVRKEGRAAVSQHSLVFGQTTVYPTINDMLTLLTPLSSRVQLGGK